MADQSSFAAVLLEAAEEIDRRRKAEGMARAKGVPLARFMGALIGDAIALKCQEANIIFDHCFQRYIDVGKSVPFKDGPSPYLVAAAHLRDVAERMLGSRAGEAAAGQPAKG